MWKGCSRRVINASALLLAVCPGALASDCNKNGTEDWLEITGGTLPDCNENGVPDPCDILPVNYRIAARGALPVGFPIGSAAAADFDGDGDPDLAMGHHGFSVASILWNFGGGGFSEPDHLDVEIPTSGLAIGASGLALGDVDGDRRVDIVVTTPTGLVFFINRGSRQFSRRPVEVAQSNRPLLSVLLSDFDGDGRLDIAATAPFKVLVLLNGAGGSFSGLPISIPIGSNPVALAAGRIDADSGIDIVTANHLESEVSGNVSVLLNAGGGTFAAPRNFGVAAGPTSVAVGDLNADGKADVATACLTAGVICVLMGTGDGTLTDGPALKVSGFPNSVSMSDLDGDSDLDLASSLLGQFGPGSVSVALNHGDASFAKVLDFPSGFQPFSLFTGDVTGDGVPEVCAGLEIGTFLILEHVEATHDSDCNSSGIPDACELRGNDCNGNGLLDLCDIASGLSFDCNANQKPDECEPDCNSNEVPDDCDLASGTSENCNQNGVPDECDVGPSAFHFDASDLKSSPNIVIQLQSADLDNDGRTDIFGVQQSISAVVFWNGQVGFDPPVDHATGMQVNAVAAGDVDGDADMDLIVGDAQLSRVVLLAQDKRSFGAGVTIGSAQFPVALSAADIDGDTDVDIVVADGSRAVLQFFSNDGSGNFAPSGQEMPILMPAFFQLANVDDDGKPDLVFARQETGLLGVSWNEAGRFDTVTGISGRATPAFLSVADIDGDGDFDVIGGIFDGFTIAVQDSPRRFRIVEIIAPIQFPFGFSAADLDGDGDSDLAAPSFTITGKPALALLRNRGGVSFDQPALRLVPFFLGPITSGGYDGDPRIDLVASAQPFCPNGNCAFEPRLATFLNRTHVATSFDVNANHRPDECETGSAFRRGDSTGDGNLDVSDAVFTLRMLFSGGSIPSCAEAADTDNDGGLSLSDPVLVLEFRVRGGPPPAAPGPGACGFDPDPVGSPTLGCVSYTSC